MRKFLIFLVLVLPSVALCASPFGLRMGMTLKDIAAQCEGEPSFLKGDVYSVRPIKRHPLFDTYAVGVSKTAGLYRIVALSSPIKTNKYGTELKEAFNSVKNRISKVYGEACIVDECKKEYDPEDDWFYYLREGTQVLGAVWNDPDSLTDDLQAVGLECRHETGLYDGTARLRLIYSFTNEDDIQDEADSVF